MSTHCPINFTKSPRSKLERSPKRGSYDQESIFRIIDAAPICHVGFSMGGQPFVIPTIHARQDDVLFFHGSTQSRLIQAIASGQPICATFTFLDGIVVARSAMHHSMNYRSVVAFGSGRFITDLEQKTEAFRLTVEKLLPGRWNECRQPNDAEEKATAIVALTIEEASLKERSGPPSDVESDYALPYWAGVIPMRQTADEAIPDPRLPQTVPIPEHIQQLIRAEGQK